MSIAAGELSAEVYRCASWPIQQGAVRLWAAFLRATGAAELPALVAFYECFLAEAQPTWDLIDHRGPIEPNAGGMLRLNHIEAAALILELAQTLEDKPSAVDEMVPDGPLRDELNRQLRSKRRAGGE